eukprot:gene27679-7813_t
MPCQCPFCGAFMHSSQGVSYRHTPSADVLDTFKLMDGYLDGMGYCKEIAERAAATLPVRLHRLLIGGLHLGITPMNKLWDRALVAAGLAPEKMSKNGKKTYKDMTKARRRGGRILAKYGIKLKKHCGRRGWTKELLHRFAENLSSIVQDLFPGQPEEQRLWWHVFSYFLHCVWRMQHVPWEPADPAQFRVGDYVIVTPEGRKGFIRRVSDEGVVLACPSGDPSDLDTRPLRLPPNRVADMRHVTVSEAARDFERLWFKHDVLRDSGVSLYLHLLFAHAGDMQKEFGSPGRAGDHVVEAFHSYFGRRLRNTLQQRDVRAATQDCILASLPGMRAAQAEPRGPGDTPRADRRVPPAARATGGWPDRGGGQ